MTLNYIKRMTMVRRIILRIRHNIYNIYGSNIAYIISMFEDRFDNNIYLKRVI